MVEPPAARLLERRQFVAGRGGPFHVVSWGELDRPAVLCLHGAVMNAIWWRGVAEELVAHGYCVIAPDQRGHGLSPAEGEFSVDEAVEDVMTVLLGLGLPRVVLAGHRTGAKTAAAVAVRYPEAVEALVLVAPLRPHANDDYMRRLQALDPDAATPILATYESWDHELRPQPSFDAALETIRSLRPYRPLTRWNLEGWLAQIRIDEQTGAVLPRTNPRAIFHGMRNVFTATDLSADLHRIQCPTLVVQCSRSYRTTELADAAYLSSIPDVQSICVDGHDWVIGENPVAVARAMLHFLAAL